MRIQRTNQIGKLFLSLAAVGFVSGCASVNSVSLTPIPSNRSAVVKAEVTKTIFLAFNFDNDFVDELVTELKRQCPKGVVTGILTKDETIAYVIVFQKRVTATGFCNTALAKRDKVKGEKSTRSTASAAEDNVVDSELVESTSN